MNNQQSNELDPVSDELHVAATAKQDVPPDGGYGWVCVLCCFLINAHTWGIKPSYGKQCRYFLSNSSAQAGRSEVFLADSVSLLES